MFGRSAYAAACWAWALAVSTHAQVQGRSAGTCKLDIEGSKPCVPSPTRRAERPNTVAGHDLNQVGTSSVEGEARRLRFYATSSTLAPSSGLALACPRFGEHCGKRRSLNSLRSLPGQTPCGRSQTGLGSRPLRAREPIPYGSQFGQHRVWLQTDCRPKGCAAASNFPGCELP